ncbi:MAG TPA: anti-sigma factor [Pseudonocardia sp.]
MSSPDVHLLTGAYVLDALGQFERRQFETHLGECPECAREVQELRATAAMLAVAVAEQPPERLRSKVLAQVSTTRQDSPADTSNPARPADRMSRRRWVGWLSAAAAAVVLSVVTVHAAHQRDAAQAELTQLQAQYASVLRIAAAPDARGENGTGVNGGTAFVLASHQLNQAVLLVSDLPATPSGHTYQAWVIGGGHVRSVGLIPAQQPGTAIPPLTFGGLIGASKIGLTIEPAGGSAQPTTTPVVLFGLPG